MPLKLDIEKNLVTRSDRVKSVDLHPSEPWVLASLYNGQLFIWNYMTQTVVKNVEVCVNPLRCAKFVVRKQWIVCGADDMYIRVFNMYTLEKVASFEAHLDYIRCLDVHPTQPFIISGSDDMLIKLWNWEAKWACQQVFEGHRHYVMQCKWNPKDSNTFVSASLDRSIKVWGIGGPDPNYSLEGHEDGINCFDFYHGGEKPYLVSGADDHVIKIWDYQSKNCMQTLSGHTGNISAVMFHPELPLILSASEDGTVRMWHNTTYRLEATLNYGMERCWSISLVPNSNKVALGYDEGLIVLALGQDRPVCSLDSSGKLLLTSGKSNDIQSCSLRGASVANAADGDPIEVAMKELGTCEVFPQKMLHNSNGRFVAVCGDGEYIIYTAKALRNKSFGSALDFCWSSEGTGDYAVRESNSRIRIFRNFEEARVFKPPFTCETIFGGNLICVAGSEVVLFVDWSGCRLVMRIDVPGPRDVFWSTDGEYVVLACNKQFYVLSCNQLLLREALSSETEIPEDGIEGSFTLLQEFAETVESGQWVGGCFLYTNSSGRLNYYVGGQVLTLAHLDRSLFLLGFVAKENRVFLIDKNRTITSYVLLESVLHYQTAVVRQDFELANELLTCVPREKYNEIARFLESQGFKEVALMVADDPEQRFDLAIQLEKLDFAFEILQKDLIPAVTGPGDSDDIENIEIQTRWKQLGDLALAGGNLKLAEICAEKAADYAGLLLMYTSWGDAASLQSLAAKTMEKDHANISFLCHFLLGDLSKCIEVLGAAGRNAEAAFFAHTYIPSETRSCVEAWKQSFVANESQKSIAIADPDQNPELFANFENALRVEALANKLRSEKAYPSSEYPKIRENIGIVLTEFASEHGLDAIDSIFSPYLVAGDSLKTEKGDSDFTKPENVDSLRLDTREVIDESGGAVAASNSAVETVDTGLLQESTVELSDEALPNVAQRSSEANTEEENDGYSEENCSDDDLDGYKDWS